MGVRNQNKNNNIYKKFIGCFTKKGKKVKAFTSLINSLENVCAKTNIKGIQAIRLITLNLGNIVDMRSVIIRKNSFAVPLPVGSRRRNYLIAKQIHNILSSDKIRSSMQNKLSQELLNVVRFKNSKAIASKNKILKEANLYKSNQHFRW